MFIIIYDEKLFNFNRLKISREISLFIIIIYLVNNGHHE